MPDHLPIVPSHGYPFDPTHGYVLETLLQVGCPEAPVDYESFWRSRYARVRQLAAQSKITETGVERDGWRIFDWQYVSTDQVVIRGWALFPMSGAVRRAFVVGHGYGGREQPDFDLPLEEAALFFPCARGLGRSLLPRVSAEPYWHVLHHIEDKERYVLGGCVEDLWMAVTAALEHVPQATGHVGYLGISFGGGVGVMAAAWEERLQRAHVNVPSFGNQPLRMKLSTVGSAASVQRFIRRKPEAMEVLRYYDAAIAARYVRMPFHCACAVFDPAVAPAGQFAIYNALPGDKQLFVLHAGHHECPGMASQQEGLRQEVHAFFRDL